MAHNLYLGMYTYSVKKKRTRNASIIDNNDFLELAYPSVSDNKFSNGFVQEIISLLDAKAYKNSQNTHGAMLDDYKIDQTERTLDILIDGGLTGIKQFIIDDEGTKSELSDEDIVGPKFFARFWMPAGTKTVYVFIQKYGSMSIKPIFDSIVYDLLDKHGFSITDKLKATTTKKRLNTFLKNAALKNITVVSTSGLNATGEAEASTVEVKLRNFKALKKTDKLTDVSNIKEALKKHGFTMGNRKYDIKGTYEYSHDGINEERTVKLDATEETINIIPNIVIPPYCIDSDNYPIFDEMIKLVIDEMKQVKIEAKM
ncbi:MAG: hypothetical protein K0R65_862 [Crocinitomicaceae bacterium]|jgi:hypothetical protein|nr:hypothetical protein [Crocinitomicaceae bacterium]